jgi:type III polyketide synthase
LLETLPDSTLSRVPQNPSEFDWPLQASYFLLNAVRKAIGIHNDNFKASWEVYENYANTTSSSVLCVLDMSRRIEKREWLVSVGFGAGVAGEAVLLRRIKREASVRAAL